MQNYRVMTQIMGVSKKPIPVGEVVPASLFSRADLKQLEAMGALDEIDAPATIADAKPLAKITRKELDAIVAAEGVALPASGKTNAEIVAAIEAARAAKVSAGGETQG